MLRCPKYEILSHGARETCVSGALCALECGGLYNAIEAAGSMPNATMHAGSSASVGGVQRASRGGCAAGHSFTASLPFNILPLPPLSRALHNNTGSDTSCICGKV